MLLFSSAASNNRKSYYKIILCILLMLGCVCVPCLFLGAMGYSAVCDNTRAVQI